MESVEIRSEKKRGRKRKSIDVQNVEVDKDGKKRMVGRGKALVDRYVRKEFEGSGLFLGKIVSYDSGLYRVDYEDGDCEDLESSEVKDFLIPETDINHEWLERKKKLDALVTSKGVKVENNLNGDKMVHVETSEAAAADTIKSEVGNLAPEELGKGFTDNQAEVSAVSEVSNPDYELSSGVANHDAVEVQVSRDGNSDLSTDSSEDEMEQDCGLEVEVPFVPRPELPPSSRNVGIPEEYVSHLFSVYSFLRSFSIQLFLSPFKLDDFVGSLNCVVPNTLLDSIHVALMRALRRHFEKLSSDGSELASRCLRTVDWSLLDALTWPIYVVHYLLVMGYTDSLEWKEFYTHALKKDYYTLSVGRKLSILQILCDDVLDTEELRAEIDMREELEVGTDSETGIFTPANGPRRVHPRNSKTSACKDQEMREFIGRNHDTKSCAGQLFSKGHGQDASCEVDHDSNGDDCRLCGMDGTLLCCDGCPASYHSRCIGVSKMFIPDGPWYCPECSIKKSGPRIAGGTTLTGAEIFGIDAYEQAFVSACDHLLVLNASVGSYFCLRYYNENDIPLVIKAIQSNEQHISMYSEICKGIIQYWGIPVDIISISGQPVNDEQKEDAKSTFSGTEGHIVSETMENEETLSFLSCTGLGTAMPGNVGSFNTMTNLDHYGQHGTEGTTEEQAGSAVKAMVPVGIQVKSITFTDAANEHADDPLVLRQQEKSVMATTCTPRSMVGSLNEHVGAPIVTKFIIRHREAKIGVCDGDDSNSVKSFLYMGSSFKSQGYINNYLHGDFAASAAANLALLSCEENQVLESHVSDRRKFISANFSLQVKAFSSAATRFFWPHMEKKLIEVPRERCSWCLSCKASVVSKRGCLLNAAASNAIKGSMKILAGLRPPKSGEGTLPGIATYIMFMEESLCGLTIGPFKNAAFRRQWRAQVEQANNLCSLKILLLELEENIRPIALSWEWVKLVDGLSAESSIIENATSAVGSTQKRKPGRPGRRGRKPSMITEVNPDDAQDTLTDFTWWRGNMLSVLLFQKGSLPHSLVKKTARQGGSKKIPGIYYPEGSETSKRSRRLVWQTAVEMSRNTSQLALQVRYLDLYVRWNDLVRPELSAQDAKGPETEASAFRNAYVCDKKIVENETRYGVAFRSQKHLPSRVMKTVIEVEQSQDGKEKYWFAETRIPLYLIKEYEEHCMKEASVNMPVNALAKLRSRHSKVSRKNVFSYLVRKRDKCEMQDCSVCKLDVLQGDLVKCSACEGLCHEQCTFSSMVQISDEVEFLITCKQCYQSKLVNQSSYESPTSPLLLQGQEFPIDTMVHQAEKFATGNNSSPSGDVFPPPKYSKPNTASKSADKSKRKLASWGLIWRKKNCDDTGTDFRLKHILLKGNHKMDGSSIVCHLCRKPYNPNLMYIRCQNCSNWYHAEAIELEESKILELVGFKCCRCRRIRSPVCPYSDKSDAINKKQLEERKIRIRPPKQGSVEKNPELVVSQNVNMDHSNSILPKKEEVAYVASNDPLHFTHLRAEQPTKYGANANFELNSGILSGSGPQKLPVRRHNKRETDTDLHSLASESSHIEVTISGGNTAEKLVPSPAEWGVSTEGFDEDVVFDYGGLNYEDMEFEPQTYFSFNELLASDDGGTLAGIEASSGNAAEPWENFSLFPSDDVAHASDNQQDPTISIRPVDVVPCKMCSHTEPYPDLSCQICGLQIHSHCSPWDEDSYNDVCWKCGNCREWR